ncbi:MAG: M15 family metallopeptidase [Clostridia bacterium]|nr:M15 family metallopeptidase [Clostridia bacterium]
MPEITRACLALILSCGLAYGGWSEIAPHADPYFDSLILVNRENRAPIAAPSLVLPDVPPARSGNASNVYMQPNAANALEQLFAAAQVEQGYLLYAVSGYRSAGTQGAIYERRVEQSGEAAKRWVAPGGFSEHQTGLAMDVTGASVRDLGLTQRFGDSEEGLWVAHNAHRFGFIIRYQRGWEQITGYNYEPWHLRYVGLEHAARMYELYIPLEEYLALLQQERVNEVLVALGLAPLITPTPTPDPTPMPTLELTPMPLMTLAPEAIPSQPTGDNPFGTPRPIERP